VDDRGPAGVVVSVLEQAGIALHKVTTREAVTEMAGRYDGFTLVVDDRGPAGVVVSVLEQAGIALHKVTTREAVQACGGLLVAARDGRLRHRGQRPLDAAVSGVKRRTVGDAWAWGRKTSASDIAPLEAVSLARWALSGLKSGTDSDPLVFAY